VEDFEAEIYHAYRLAGNDNDVGAVILTSGIDGVFSGGLDLKETAGRSGSDHRPHYKRVYWQAHDIQYRIGKPTIAAVPGAALAGGMTLAVLCNCIIVAEDAKLGYPEPNHGIIPGKHLVHLPRQIGRHKAFELLFSGEPFSGATAEEIGLVNQAVPEEDVKPTARDLARKFAEHNREVMELGHNMFMRLHDYRHEMEQIVDALCYNFYMNASQEGRDQFAEGSGWKT
jgi:enoyl-CoA hydratase/carnithine racemase